MNPENTESKRNGNVRWLWRSLVLLVSLTLVSQLINLWWNASVAFASLVLPSSLVIMLTTAPLAAAGLWLGRGLGLGAPHIASLAGRTPGTTRSLLTDAGYAAAFGIVFGLFFLVVRALTSDSLPANMPVFGYRGFTGGVLVSISAAITEEIWLRLGAMTIFAWLFSRISARGSLSPAIAWTSIVAAAILFAVIHLPNLSSQGAATSYSIAATIAGNTLVGILYGWLYWRRGLEAAIVGHLSVDVVLHAAPALF